MFEAKIVVENQDDGTQSTFKHILLDTGLIKVDLVWA